MDTDATFDFDDTEFNFETDKDISNDEVVSSHIVPDKDNDPSTGVNKGYRALLTPKSDKVILQRVKWEFKSNFREVKDVIHEEVYPIRFIQTFIDELNLIPENTLEPQEKLPVPDYLGE